MVTTLRTRLAAIVAVIAVVFSGLVNTQPATAAVVGAPTAPTALVVTGGIRSASLSWSAPTSAGTSAVTSYTVQYSASSTFNPVLGSQTITNGTTASLSNLSNSAVYYARVAASNSAGISPWTTAAKFTTATKPAAPAGLKVTPGVNSATVTWTAPTVTGGAPITGYSVQYSQDLTMATGVTTVAVGSSSLSFTATGLLTATQYAFRVAAVNEIGTSTYSTIAKGPTATTAAAPTGSKAVQGNGQVVLSWSTPTVTGGSAITGYRIQYATDALFTTGVQALDVSDPAAKTYTVTGLSTGTKYYFRLATMNGVGAGAYAVAVFATTFAVPAAPTVPLAKATGKGSVALSWKAPTINGGSAVTGYTVEWSKSSTFATVDGSQTVGPVVATSITGLNDNTPYYFRVYANNVVGSSVASTSATISTWNVPTAPNSPLAKSTGKGTVTVTWTAPANNGGGAVTGYTIEYSKSATFATVDGTRTVGALLTGTVTGLEDGTAYYFRVYATNVVGNGATSAVTAATTTFTAPSVPNAFTVAPGKTSIVAKWTAPTSTGGAAVSGYRIQWSTAADFSTVAGTVDATGLTYTIANLTPGTLYYVRVAALNVVGASAYTAAGSATVFSAPTAPRNLVVVGGAAKVTATWQAPSSTGGTPVTSYLVQYTTDSAFATGVASLNVTGTTLTASPIGLAAGTTYYVRVTAINVAGSSAATDAVSGTTVSAPTAPSNVVTRATSASTATITWNAAVANGAAVTGYSLQYSTDSTFATGVTTVPVRIPTAPATPSYAVAGLTEGATYYVRVSALSTAGASTYSSTASTTMWSRPAAPTGLTADAGVGTVSTAWTAPENTGSHPIVGYRILVATNALFSNPQTVDTTDTAVTKQFVNFAAGTTYYVKVAAKTLAGVSAYSETVTATTPDFPGAVTDVTATWTTATSATVTWTAPVNNGGTPVTEYRIQYSPSVTFTSNTTTLTVTGTSADLTNLNYGTRYYVRVAAVNAVGTGANAIATNDLSALRPAKPGAPTVTVASKTSLTVSWTAPESNGCTITAYAVQVDDDSAFGSPTTASTAALTRTFAGLTTGTTYYARVQAANACGTSAQSDAASAVPASAAEAPTGLTVTVAGATSLNATWTVPADNGSAITGYRVQYSTDRTFNDGVSVLDTTDANATITGLTTGTVYYVKVAAINGYGVGTYSNDRGRTPGTAPSAPTLGTTLVPGKSMSADSKGTLKVRWSTPAENGYALTGYVLQYAKAADFSDAASVELPVTASESRTYEEYSLTGLADSTEYNVRIAAVNELGTGEWSVTESLATIAAPTEVQDLTAGSSANDVSGFGYIDLSWTNATNSDALYYHIYVDGSEYGSRISATENTLRLRKISFGQHTFTITPENDLYGLGAGTSITATVTGAPDAPTAPVVTYDTCDAVHVTWNTPADNSATITGYELSYGTIVDSFGAGVTSADISLTCGSSYDVKVRALNSVGAGEWSPVASVQPDQAPAQVTSTLTQTVDGLTVQWTQPGLPYTTVDGYLVQYSKDANFASGVTAVTVAGRTTTTYDISNLGLGITYYVRVAAYNQSGLAPWSLTTSATTWNTADAAATMTGSFTSSSGITYVNLQWTDGASNGGTPVTGYNVYVNGFLVAENVAGGSWSANVDTISQIVPGQTATYTVRPVNAVGIGQPTSITLLFASAPTTVSNVTASPTSSTSLLVSWDASTSLGSSITGYIIEERLADDSLGRTITTDNNSTSYEFTNLTAGATYSYRVKAVNTLGMQSDAWSAYGSGVPAAAPSALTITDIVPGGQMVDVSMSTPDSNGSAILGYRIQYATDAAFTENVTVMSFDASQNNRSIMLDYGVTYYVRALAYNEMGNGAWSAAQTAKALTIPSAPTDFDWYPGATTVTLVWKAPADNPYSTGYAIYKDGQQIAITEAGITAYTVENLAQGTTYYFEVAALNSAYTGAKTGGYVWTLDVPDAPGSVTATATEDGHPIVTWTEPAEVGYAPTLYYTIFVYENGEQIVTPTVVNDPNMGTAELAMTMVPGHTYKFWVTATNIVGESQPTSSSPYLYQTAPDAPSGVNSVVTSVSTMAVSWTAPAANGAAITDYAVEYSTDGGSTWTTFNDGVSTATNATVTGLTAGSTYSFRVKAENIKGLSAYSTASTGLLLATVPGVPAGVSRSVDTTTSMLVAWNAPAANGAAITDYTIQYSSNAGITWTTFNDGVSTNTTVKVTGLTTGSTYRFRVAATNALGTSAYGSESSDLLLATAPDAPSLSSLIVVSPTSLNASWSAPAANGSAITAYTVLYSKDSAFSTGVNAVAVTSTSTTLTGLDAGYVYYVKVRATNSIANSADSNVESARPIGAPTGAPASPSITGTGYDSQYINIGWNSLSGNATGGATVSYRVQMSTSQSFGSIFNEFTTSGSSVTNVYAGSGVMYVRVMAFNTYGNGPWSQISLAQYINTGTGYQFWNDYKYQYYQSGYYYCPNGGTLSGTTCSGTSTYAATSTIISYTCKTISSGTGYTYCNSQDGAYGATKTSGTRYTATANYGYYCPNGGSLSGSTCTVSSSYTASYQSGYYYYVGDWDFHYYYVWQQTGSGL